MMADSRHSNDGFCSRARESWRHGIARHLHVAINDDNASVAVTFNEETFNTAGASGSVEKTDLRFP